MTTSPPAASAQPAAQWARACWAAVEPFSLGFFFGPDTVALLEGAGLPGQIAYFVTRAAPLGAAHPAVVTSAFHGFPYATAAAIFPGAWTRLPPEEAIAGTHDVVSAFCARVFGQHATNTRVERIADLLVEAAAGLNTTGRPLAAGNQAVTLPDEPWARFWRATTTLREFRGDGHIAALVGADLGIDDAQVLISAWAGEQVDTTFLRSSRNISDEAWAAAQSRLAERSLLDADDAITPAGRALRDGIEQQTDASAAAPWRALGAEQVQEVWQFSRDVSQMLLDAGRMRAVTPVGAPWPPPAPAV